jgi:hypothetical protein
MLDQNTTTVITTLITAGSPLVALYLGIVLGRKHEDRKWSRERREEFYELTVKVYRYARDLFGNEKFTTDLYETIVPYTLRMTVLANLYLRPVKSQFAEFINELENVHKTHEKLFLIFSSPENNTDEEREEAFKEAKQAIELFEKKYKNLKDGLEKLVR